MEPKILEVDGSQWSGEIGQVIRVRAKDNVMVTRVVLSIQDAQGNILEEGEAVHTAPTSDWWEYTASTQVASAAAAQVFISAYDLPGHSGNVIWQID